MLKKPERPVSRNPPTARPPFRVCPTTSMLLGAKPPPAWLELMKLLLACAKSVEEQPTGMRRRSLVRAMVDVRQALAWGWHWTLD